MSKPVISYISSSMLDEEELISEAINFINQMATKKIESEENVQRTTIQKLTDNFLELENEEFNECVEDVLSNLKQGNYSLEVIGVIFNRFETFLQNKLISIHIEELNQIFFESIKVSNPRGTTSDRLDMMFIEKKSSELLLIEEAIKTRYKEVRSQHLIKGIQDIVSLLPENVGDFVEQYYKLARSTEGHNAIMQFIDMPDFISKLKILSNKDLNSIRSLFNNVYSFSNIYEYFMEDYKPMIKLIRLIRKHQKELDGMKLFAFKLIGDDLLEFARRLIRKERIRF